jgi:hypothetical protein
MSLAAAGREVEAQALAAQWCEHEPRQDTGQRQRNRAEMREIADASNRGRTAELASAHVDAARAVLGLGPWHGFRPVRSL